MISSTLIITLIITNIISFLFVIFKETFNRNNNKIDKRIDKINELLNIHKSISLDINDVIKSYNTLIAAYNYCLNVGDESKSISKKINAISYHIIHNKSQLPNDILNLYNKNFSYSQMFSNISNELTVGNRDINLRNEVLSFHNNQYDHIIEDVLNHFKEFDKVFIHTSSELCDDIFITISYLKNIQIYITYIKEYYKSTIDELESHSENNIKLQNIKQQIVDEVNFLPRYKRIHILKEIETLESNISDYIKIRKEYGNDIYNYSSIKALKAHENITQLNEECPTTNLGILSNESVCDCLYNAKQDYKNISHDDNMKIYYDKIKENINTYVGITNNIKHIMHKSYIEYVWESIYILIVNYYNKKKVN